MALLAAALLAGVVGDLSGDVSGPAPVEGASNQPEGQATDPARSGPTSSSRARSEPAPTPAPDDGPAAAAPDQVPSGAQPATVARIVDGDTVWVRVDRAGGPLPPGAVHKIRLLGYDAPEDTRTTECGGPEATAALERLMPPDTTVYLVADEEDTDRYGRFLRYVHTADGKFVNLEMVRRGHGEAVVYQPNDAHIDALRRAERQARQADRGMWAGPCHEGRASTPTPGAGSGDAGGCASSYPDVCIPPPPPDLDCPDVGHRDFRVTGSDPHRFDRNGDGRGCESP